MNHIEHIGIAVKSLEVSQPLFETLLNTNCYKTEIVEGEGVKTAFYKVGDTKIELLESIQEDGVIGKFIRNKGEGVHHIAFAVENLREEISRLTSAGFRVLNEEPKAGADNKWVCFLHPKDTNSVLVELCEERK